MNPAYLQLLQAKGLNLARATPITNINRGGLSADIPNSQPAIREQGFGTRFKDTPPEFINTKEDNKIERLKKPTKKKTRRTKKKSK